MYVKLEGENTIFPYMLRQFREENPSTSFPAKVSAETLERHNVFEVTRTEKPKYDNLTHFLTSGVEKKGESWVQTWKVAQLPLEQASDNIKQIRTKLLMETDWCALSDVEMSEEMRSYRQQLRDITKQDGFPYSVSWPEKPER